MCGGMTVVCAYETAGVDVKQTLRIASVKAAAGRPPEFGYDQSLRAA